MERNRDLIAGSTLIVDNTKLERRSEVQERFDVLMALTESGLSAISFRHIR